MFSDHQPCHLKIRYVMCPPFSIFQGLSILTLCIVYNNNDSLRVLLEARAVPNPKDGFGCTPLYYAAFSNNAKGARLLCDFHADPNIKNKFLDNKLGLSGEYCECSGFATDDWNFSFESMDGRRGCFSIVVDFLNFEISFSEVERDEQEMHRGANTTICCQDPIEILQFFQMVQIYTLQ